MSSDIQMQNQKKKRDPTFSAADKNIFVDIIQKYYDIIENKKTDNETMSSKNHCWEKKITAEYNSGVSIPRATSVLKNCWKNLKAEARKVAADERQGRIQTGGGPKKKVSDDPVMFRIIDLIRPSAVGLNNSYDTDGNFDKDINTQTQDEGNHEGNHNAEREIAGDTQDNVSELLQYASNLNGDWSQYTPGRMRTPRTTILRKLPQSLIEVAEDGSFVLDLEVEEDLNGNKDTELHSNTSKEVRTPNKRAAIRPMTAAEIAPKRPRREENSSRHQTNRRRPVISQAKNDELLCKRVEALTKVTSHAEEEHQILMEINREKLRQERIRTRILLLELKAAKRQYKN